MQTKSIWNDKLFGLRIFKCNSNINDEILRRDRMQFQFFYILLHIHNDNIHLDHGTLIDYDGTFLLDGHHFSTLKRESRLQVNGKSKWGGSKHAGDDFVDVNVDTDYDSDYNSISANEIHF